MLQLTLSADPRSAAEARRFADDVLRDWDEEPLSDAVELLVSELVTNAVLHAGPPVHVALWRRSDRIHVDVLDDSAVPPGLRDYDAEATTGRGLALVDLVAADWGVESRNPRGKVVWFEVLATHPDAPATGDAAPPQAEPVEAVVADEYVTVRLVGAPVRLFPAMQQHTDALLREYALIGLDSNGGAPPPRLEIDLNPIADQVATAAGAGNATTELTVRVPVSAKPNIAQLCDALEHADAMAVNGLLLNPPTLPEVRGCRDWFFSQIAAQLDGEDPAPWVVSMSTDEVREDISTDYGAVLDLLSDAVVVADDQNHIAYVNSATELLLGWRAEDLVGRRLPTIIPERLREAHIAGFTRFLVTREARILGQPVRVPARRRDGTEVDVELRLQAFRPPGQRQMFMATLRQVEPPPPAPAPQPASGALALVAAMTIDLPAPGAADARARMLERLGRHAQWAVVSWWRIDGERLLCADVWQADPAAHPRFIKATMVRRFALGEGLPGRVWAAGAAEWIPDVVADANFPRVGLALQEQLRAACAFPVVHDGHVTGVIEMYGDTVAPIDAELLLALESIGRLCGAVTGGATPG